MSVALQGRPDQWQHAAARGLITDPRGAIRSLERFDNPEARFYGAVLEWMDGDDDRACRGWERLGGPYALNLLNLVRKPRIDVLSMLPPLRHGAFVIADGIVHDRKFRVRNSVLCQATRRSGPTRPSRNSSTERPRRTSSSAT